MLILSTSYCVYGTVYPLRAFSLAYSGAAWYAELLMFLFTLVYFFKPGAFHAFSWDTEKASLKINLGLFVEQNICYHLMIF